MESISANPYWPFLFRDWKVVTFGVASIALVLVAPYSNDPTWDVNNAALMSGLTFLTAPWAVGALYRWVRRMGATWRAGALALFFWFLSVSVAYDGYLLLRDGAYLWTWYSPQACLVNLIASSLLYLCAGLFWNLDWRPARGLTFSFVEPDWLLPTPASFRRVAWPAMLFMGLVSAMILPLLWLGSA